MATKKPVKKPKNKAPKAPLTPEQARAKAQDRVLAGLYTQQGVSSGNALTDKFIPDKGLGRVNEDLAGSTQNLNRYQNLYDQYRTRAPEQADVMNRMQQGLGGYTAPELQAQREQMYRAQNSNYLTAQNQLAKAQARAKVYGAAGAAQQANLQRSTQENKNQLEQDLYVKNIDEQQKRLGEYGQYGRGLNQEEFTRQAAATKGYGDEEARLRDEELKRQQFNIGQSNAEIAGRIGLFTGAGGTALSERANRIAQDLARQGLNKI